MHLLQAQYVKQQQTIDSTLKIPDKRIHSCGRKEWGIPARIMVLNLSVLGNCISTLSQVKSDTSLL